MERGSGRLANMRGTNDNNNMRSSLNTSSSSAVSEVDMNNGLEPRFVAVADEECQFITVDCFIDYLEYLTADIASREIDATGFIGTAIKVQVRKYLGYHISERHCVVDSVTIEDMTSDYPSPLVVISNVKELNNTIFLGNATQGDLSYGGNNNNNNNDDNTDNGNGIANKLNGSNKSGRLNPSMIEGCFALNQGNRYGCDIMVYKHKETPNQKKNSVLQRYGDVTYKELKADVIRVKINNYSMVRPNSVLEHAIAVNTKKSRLFCHPDSESRVGSPIYPSNHLYAIVDCVEQYKKDNVTYINLSDAKFTIRRRDGQSFNQRNNSSFESFSAKTLSEIQARYVIGFRVRFTVKLFKNHIIPENMDDGYDDDGYIDSDVTQYSNTNANSPNLRQKVYDEYEEMPMRMRPQPK